MTVGKLYESVAQLGFETSLDDDKRFLLAANRALLQVNAIRPSTSYCIINHNPLFNKIKGATFSPMNKTEDLYFYADNVKAYYFEATGSGTMFIYDAAGKELVAHDFAGGRAFKAHRGFIKDGTDFVNGQVRMRFTGNYAYTVKCVAMYEYVYSSDKEDIPAYEAVTRYDISTLTDDFMTLSTPPIIESDGVTFMDKDFSVENGRVVLFPYENKGVYKVSYNRKPKEIESESKLSESTKVIDLDDDLCALLPTLIASYIWLEDEPEKAQYYLSLYNERALDIERRIRNVAPIPIKSVNGW